MRNARFMVMLFGCHVGVSCAAGWVTSDLYKLHWVEEVRLSQDGKSLAYTVMSCDKPGRPASQVGLMNVATGRSTAVDGSGPRWSSDGKWIAYIDSGALFIAHVDGSERKRLASVVDTNHPLPGSGTGIAWSPDGKRVAFVSSVPGPEADPKADPTVVTRYLYKPTWSEGLTRFNDNRRTHVFIADVATGAVRQLTHGDYYEHSIDWSPDGQEILFVSNRAPDPERVFNNDIFVVKVTDGSIRRITDTPSAEYNPVWSPDGNTIAYLGTKRPLTSSEATMEDTHVWVVKSDGSNRREIGAAVDNRQTAPQWSADGRFVYFGVRERGSNHLYRVSVATGASELIVGGTGSVDSWSIGPNETLAYSLTTPAAPADLFLKVKESAARQLTTVNADLLKSRSLASIEPLDFASFDGTAIEGYLTRPMKLVPGTRYPMIVRIHGGPHWDDGTGFNSVAQIYASHGYASLTVNYRGSTGYGQKLADAIFKDQDGAEAKDVLAAVDAALAKYQWIDPRRLGVEGISYGGQLTDWLVTQTTRFRAAIPIAGISNLVSFNYMAYYHDYLAVEFGSWPHENHLMDLLWERSALRYVDKVKTPVLFMHGENDNDVPIAEAEQYFIALKDVGVETAMIRYPREGHGIFETSHVADAADRSMAWYDRHFGHN